MHEYKVACHTLSLWLRCRSLSIKSSCVRISSLSWSNSSCSSCILLVLFWSCLAIVFLFESNNSISASLCCSRSAQHAFILFSEGPGSAAMAGLQGNSSGGSLGNNYQTAKALNQITPQPNQISRAATVSKKLMTCEMQIAHTETNWTKKTAK